MEVNLINPRRLVASGLFLLLLTACGSGAKSATAVPQVTPTAFPTYQFVAPTEAPIVLTVVAETATVSGNVALDPEKVDLGKGRYTALDCGSCHGDKAQGTDKGSALVGTKLTQDQFIDFLRTGGKLGNAHLYATNRLSDAGGKNLYLYIVSLSSSGASTGGQINTPAATSNP